jgi:serine/threonine-protein kinase
MAPEQAMGLDIDHRVDLYALGIIMFEMLTASVPFHHADIAKVIEMHVSAEAPHLGARRPDLAPLSRIDDVVQSLLAKARESRPSSAEAAVTALIAASGLDLGSDTADRLQRSTIQIGSGLLGDAGDAVPTAIRSEPTSWRGQPRAGERSARTDPLLVSGPVPTVGRGGASMRPSPSPARPVVIATVSAVLAAGLTFIAAQWLRGRDDDPRPRAPTNPAKPGSTTPVRAVSSTSESAPYAPRPNPSSPGVTPITAPQPSDTAAVTSASDSTSDATASPGKPQPDVERSSSRDDKAASKRRPKSDVAGGDTKRQPPATPSPTSEPRAADSAPTHPSSPPPAPDPKPSSVPGDLKDPFPAN